MTAFPSAPTLLRVAFVRLSDPFGFAEPLRWDALGPTELPGLTREARLEGLGL